MAAGSQHPVDPQTAGNSEGVSEEVKDRVVFEAHGLHYKGERENSPHLVDFDLTVLRGQFIGVLVDRRTHTGELSGLIQGVTSPSEGSLRFLGFDWDSVDYATLFSLRQKIGRVFESGGWVSNLNIIENVTLSMTNRGAPTTEIDAEIDSWSKTLETPELTRERTSFVEASRLQRFQWLRAFIGPRRLVLLERPLRALRIHEAEPLFAGIARCCKAGGSVIWFAATPVEMNRMAADCDQQFELYQGALRPFGTSDLAKQQPKRAESSDHE